MFPADKRICCRSQVKLVSSKVQQGDLRSLQRLFFQQRHWFICPHLWHLRVIHGIITPITKVLYIYIYHEISQFRTNSSQVSSVCTGCARQESLMPRKTSKVVPSGLTGWPCVETLWLIQDLRNPPLQSGIFWDFNMKNHEQSKKSGCFLGKSWNIWDFLGNFWILNWKIMTHLGECWSNHPQVAVEGHTFTRGTLMVVPHSCLSWWLISLDLMGT